jgi:NADH-quinone oxidoreductase subunit J
LIAVISAWRVIFTKHIIHAILWLVVTFFSTACLFVMLGAEFLAAIQILVYAGAIIILYVFAVMLVNVKNMDAQAQFHQQKRIGIFLGIVILAELLMVLLREFVSLGKDGPLAAQLVEWGGNTQVIGRLLYTDYILPFELISLVLLVAIIGAVVLATSRREGA